MKYADRLYANADRRKAEQEWLNKFAEQQPSKSTVGDIKESDELYTPWIGGLINGVKGLERTAYDALGGLNAQLAGWGANQYTGAGDAQRYKEFVEDNPEFAAKNMATPEQYEKTRLENPTFWQQVMGGVDEKTNYTQDEAKKLEQSWMLDAEKPWIDRGNNVENVRYSRRPSGWGEQFVTDVAANVPQLAEAALAGAASGAVGGAPGAAVGAALSMAKNIYGQSYGGLRRKGRSMDAAHGAAAVDTLYQMPFEYTGASRIFKTIPGLRRAVGKLSPEGKSKFAEWLKTVASEGSTEFAQTYGDASADDIADAIERGDFQKDFEAGAKSAGNIIYKNTLGDKAEENFKESAYAGLLGGVMGGGAHGVGIAMDAVARKLAGNPNPTQEDVVQAIVKAKNDIVQDSGNGGDNPTGGDNSFGNDVLNFLHNQTDVQMTEGQMRNLAAAMAGNAFQESGYDSTAENSIGAYGSFQHLGERRAALEAFAEENGLDPSSRQAQIAFAWKEMMTEGTLENQAFQSIMGLEDNQAKEAAVIYRKLFERPGEEEANDEARVTEAQRVHDSFTQAQQFLKDTAERMDIATEEDAALANELNRLAEEGREEEVLAKARELGFKEQREKELNQQREQIAQQTEEEQNNIPKAPQAAPTPQGQAGQLAPIQTENTQAPQAQQQLVQGMETVNKDRTAPHIDRNKANKGNFNNRGNYNGRLDAPQNKRVESPIRNQGQSAPISQQGENQNAENLQTQTTKRRENRENLNGNAQPQQTQTAENQATPQNPQGNEVTPTLAPSNQGAASIAQNMPKIASNGQNEIANKVNGEALAKATENDLTTVSEASIAKEIEAEAKESAAKAKENAVLDKDSTVFMLEKATIDNQNAVYKGSRTAKDASAKVKGARTTAKKRLDKRLANGEISKEMHKKLSERVETLADSALKRINNEPDVTKWDENTPQKYALTNKLQGFFDEAVEITRDLIRKFEDSEDINDRVSKRTWHKAKPAQEKVIQLYKKAINAIQDAYENNDITERERLKYIYFVKQGFGKCLREIKEQDAFAFGVSTPEIERLEKSLEDLPEIHLYRDSLPPEEQIQTPISAPELQALKERSIAQNKIEKEISKLSNEEASKISKKIEENVKNILDNIANAADGNVQTAKSGKETNKEVKAKDEKPNKEKTVETKKLSQKEEKSTNETADKEDTEKAEKTVKEETQNKDEDEVETITSEQMKSLSDDIFVYGWDSSEPAIATYKRAAEDVVRAARKGETTLKEAIKSVKKAWEAAYKDLSDRYAWKEPRIDEETFNALNGVMFDVYETAEIMLKPENVAYYREKRSTAKENKATKEPKTEVKPQEEKADKAKEATPNPKTKNQKTVKEEAKAPQEKPQKTKAQQKADAERDAKAKKLLTKDAYDKVYTPLVNVLEQAQSEVAKAARDTALLMAKTADILHKRFKMKWENAPRVLLGGNAILENGEYGMPTHDVRAEGIHSVSGFYKEAKNRKETKDEIENIGTANQIKYIDANGMTWLGERILHIQENEHPLTDEELDDLEKHTDMIKNLTPSAWNHGKGMGQYGWLFVGRVDGEKGTYYVTFEVNPLSGNAFLTTADKHSKEAVNNMIEERRKQFNTAIKNGKIAPQWRLKQNAVSLGSQSSVDITLSELIKKVKMLGKTFNQIAWHGSAYTFDAFDISKIGFGEGHQAHGWGLYFAKEEEVAQNYKNYVRNLVNKPAKISVNGEVFTRYDSDSFYSVRDRKRFYPTTEEYWFLLDFTGHGYNTKEYMKKEYERFMALTKDNSASDIVRDSAGWKAARYKRFLNFVENAEIKLYNAKGEEYRDNSTLFKVDIPENDVLLDEQKGYNEQSRKVKTAIRNAIKKFDLWFLEPPTGGEFYEALSEALGGDREASIYLNKKGIKGITYVGKQDGRCFVVFDDKAVKILETYEQQIKDQIAGSYNAVENLIKVFEKGNASTAVHESAHWYLVTLENLLHAEAEKRGITGTTDEILEQLAEDETMPKDLVSELQKIRNWAQYSEETMKEYEGTELEKEFTKLAKAIKNGDEDAKERFIQERFARGYERYLASGKAPTKELQGVFARFRRWLLDIYNNTIKNLGNKPAPKEIQEIFDRMLEMEETETNTGDTSGEAVKEKSKAKKNYPSGKTVNARTDKADEFPVTYKLIPIEDAITSTNEDFSINENFPQELQPRDRDRSGMKNQIKDIAGNLSPEEMTIAVKVSEGAPVINQDNIVENGNGRILALLRAYKGGSDAYDESAKRYKAYLREHAADFGFTAEQVDAIERPLLVRQRGSESDNLQRNIVESTSGGMKMSAGQQAKVDAKKISLHTLSLYNYDGSGDLDLASNGRFIKAVLDETISQYDQDSMFTADGSISRDAKNRVNNALCALAYGDTDLLDRVSESSDNDYKNYVSAYTIAAPRVAYAKKLMENGDVSEDFDVAKMLNETLEFVLQCKKENVKVSEKLRAGAGLFTPGSSQFEMDGSREFAKFLGNNIRKQRKMADTIKEIADGVIKKAENGQTTGFFSEDDTTFYDVVRNALGMGNSQFNSDDEACTLSTKDEAFDALTENQKKGLTAVAKDYGGTYDESTHTYTFPDEISLEEAREEMDALLDPTKHDFKASAQGNLAEKMRKNAKMLSEDELTDREKGIVAFAEKMGVKLRFFEGDSRLHGFQSDDVIYLNRNSAMNLNQVFWHETFHWLKRNNPKLYEALEKAVLQNDDIAAQVKAWQEKTGRTNLTEEEAIEEMLADAMFDASTRGKFFETLGITHPTLVQKLIKWIKNTYRDLVNQFRHTEGFKPEAGLTNTQISRMSIALDNMALKLVDGNGNKLFSKDAKGNLRENTVKDVRYIDGVKYKVTNKTLKDTDRVPIIDLTNAPTVDLTDKAQTDQLINSFANQPFNFIGGQGVIKKNDKNNAPDKNKQVWKQILHGHGRGKRAQKKATDPTRSKVIANLPAVLEKSVYVDKHPDSAHGTSTEYIESFAVVKNGNEYSVFCISERERGIAKSDEVGSALPYNIKKVKSLNVPQIGGSQNPLTSGIIITDVLDGVNDRNKNPYVKNGVLKHSVEITPQDTQQDTQQNTEKYSVDLSDLENGKVFNNEEQNKKAQSVQKSMELAKDSDTKHFMGKFANKLFGQKEYDTRKNVTIDGQKDYKQRAKDVSLYGVLTQIISPSRLKDERLKTIYIEGEKAKRTQAKLYSKWTEKHKKILDLVEKAEDYAGYVRALISEDSESRVFTDDELREMGCSDKVIEAHKQVRALLKEIRDKIAEVYLAKHFEVKNFKTQVEAEAWASNPFFENVEIKPMKKVGGTVWQVKYDTVPYTKTEETVTKWELDKLKEREGRGEIHILESAKVDDTMCTVSYLTPQRTLADLDQYIPHFFHEFLIIERGKRYTKVVGSATTMDEAVEIGNKLAGQKGNEKKQYTITPKGLSFEDGSNSLGIVNKELDELMDGIKDDLSIDLSEAIEAKKQKGKHIFLSALQHRKGAKGWETNLRWVIQHHIGTAARYCALDPYKVKVINYFEKAWGSFADNFVGKDLKAEFAQGLINSVLGVPTRAEKVSDAILELCPLFRNTPQASRVLSSAMLGVMSVLKLGVSPAAAFVNLTQLVNIQGYIGAKWTYEGISRAWKKSKEDMALLDELGTREEAGLETVDVSEATALIAGKYDKQLRQLKKLSDLSMKAFTKAESLLRQAAVLGAYHKALAEGKTEAAARSYALEINRKANFNYGIEDAPRLFRMLKGSVVGDLFLQFKKYGFKELEVIYDMAFDKSIPKSQKLSFFGAYFLLGGIFNALPFQDTMIELLGLALDSDDPEAEMKEWIMKWAKGSEAKKIVALTAMYGAGSWIGADVSQRVGFRGLTPELEEPLGVTGSTIKQVCTAMLNGDSVGFAKGLSPALGNVVGATKGYNTDSKGRVAYVYKDPLERALRLCGFRTIGEALSVDTQRIVTEARKEKEKERKDAKEAYLENPSYANKQKLKQLGYTDGEIKKFKGNNDSLERTERLKARMTKQELKDFKDVLDW